MPVERKAIAAKTLAEHWGITPSAVSQLKRRKGMPEFYTLAEADEWRSPNMDPRGRSPKAESMPASIPAENDSAQSVEIPATEVGRLEHAELKTYELYMRKVSEGRGAEVAVALKNYTEASKQCAAAKERWVSLLEKERQLIDRDEAKSACGNVLMPLKAQVIKMDRKYGNLDWSRETAVEHLRMIANDILKNVQAANGLLDLSLDMPLEVDDE